MTGFYNYESMLWDAGVPISELGYQMGAVSRDYQLLGLSCSLHFI